MAAGLKTREDEMIEDVAVESTETQGATESDGSELFPEHVSEAFNRPQREDSEANEPQPEQPEPEQRAQPPVDDLRKYKAIAGRTQRSLSQLQQQHEEMQRQYQQAYEENQQLRQWAQQVMASQQQQQVDDREPWEILHEQWGQQFQTLQQQLQTQQQQFAQYQEEQARNYSYATLYQSLQQNLPEPFRNNDEAIYWVGAVVEKHINEAIARGRPLNATEIDQHVQRGARLLAKSIENGRASTQIADAKRSRRAVAKTVPSQSKSPKGTRPTIRQILENPEVAEQHALDRITEIMNEHSKGG